MSTEVRPNIPMSVEEHGALAQLTASVTDLTASVRVLTNNQTRLEGLVTTLAESTTNKFEALHKTGELSWSKVGSLVLFALAIASPLYSVLSMKIDGSLAPVRQDQSVAVAERAGDHARILSLEGRMQHAEEHQAAADNQFTDRNAKQDQQLGEVYYHDFGRYPRN